MQFLYINFIIFLISIRIVFKKIKCNIGLISIIVEVTIPTVAIEVGI